MSKRQENRGSFEKHRLKGQRCLSELFSAAAASHRGPYNLANFLTKHMAEVLQPGRKFPPGCSFVCLFVWLIPTHTNTHLSLSLPFLPHAHSQEQICVGEPFSNAAPPVPAAPHSPWQPPKKMDHQLLPQREEFWCLQVVGVQGRGTVIAVVSC